MAHDDEEYEEFEPVKGSYAVVHSFPDRPVVACTVFDDRDAPLAHRQWILQPDGVHVLCSCTQDGKPLKVKANADGTTEIAAPYSEDCSDTIAPEPIETIHEQVISEVEQFCDDWGVRPIRYYWREADTEKVTRTLKLAGLWLDEDALDYSAASWYLAEGERILADIEDTSGELDKVRAKFPDHTEPWDDVRPASN